MKKAERQSFTNDLKAAAFTAWRMELALSGLFGGQAKISFIDYCERMGLLTQQEKDHNAALKMMQRLADKQTVKAAAANADEIMKRDREQQMLKKQQKGG